MLQQSVRNNTQILISLRNNKKLLARVKAFDRHSNMVLENVKEVSCLTAPAGMPGHASTSWKAAHTPLLRHAARSQMWTEVPKNKNKKPVNVSASPWPDHAYLCRRAEVLTNPQTPTQKDRFISKMFLRGDSVVLGEWQPCGCMCFPGRCVLADVAHKPTSRTRAHSAPQHRIEPLPCL